MYTHVYIYVYIRISFIKRYGLKLKQKKVIKSGTNTIIGIFKVMFQ